MIGRSEPDQGGPGILLLSLGSHWTASVVDCLVVVATLRRKLVLPSPGSSGRERALVSHTIQY